MEDFEITVKVEDFSGKLTLRQYIGEGDYGGVPIELAVTLPNHSPFVKVGDQCFVVNIHDIAKAIAKHVIAGE